MPDAPLVERIKASCSRGIAALALLAAFSGCGAVSMFQQDYPKRFDKPPLEYIINNGKSGDESLELRASPANKYALLVKGKDDSIFVDGDIKNMAKLLLLKNYDIYYITPKNKAAIRDFCSRLSDFANDSTQLFVLLTGHGSSSGFCLKPFLEVGNSVYYATLSPSDLFGWLRGVRGRKAVLVNCCKAGIFYEYLADAPSRSGDKSFFNGVLFASCPEDKLSICDPLLGMSAFAYGFCNFFAPEIGEVDLARVAVSQQMTPLSEFIVFLGRLFGYNVSYETKFFATSGYKF